MVMVPVVTVQVGCITVAVGTAGVTGAAFTTNGNDAGDVHPAAFCTVMVYDAGVSPVKTGDAWYGPPLMLYCNPAPVGAVILMVPVGVVQVGCVMVPVGAAGVLGAAFSTKGVEAGDVQPAAFCTVKVYDPGVSPEKTGEGW